MAESYYHDGVDQYGRGFTEWAEASHVDSMNTTVKADQWLDWDGVTVAVEPMAHKLWLHDSNSERHQLHENTGRRYDARDVSRLIQWEDRHGPEEKVYYTPSVRTLNSIRPFAGPCASKLNEWQVGKLPMDGQRPTISQMIFDGSLPDKAIGDIEAEMREAERSLQARLFSSGAAPGGAAVAA